MKRATTRLSIWFVLKYAVFFCVPVLAVFIAGTQVIDHVVGPRPTVPPATLLVWAEWTLIPFAVLWALVIGLLATTRSGTMWGGLAVGAVVAGGMVAELFFTLWLPRSLRRGLPINARGYFFIATLGLEYLIPFAVGAALGAGLLRRRRAEEATSRP